MLKVILAGATALAIAGSTLVYAQQSSGHDPAGPERRGQHQRWQMSAEDAEAFSDARIAALKAGLRLTPDQEKSWPAVEAAMRELSKDRIARTEERRKQREAQGDQPRERDILAALRQRAEIMGKRAAGLSRLADAAEPLYKSLDDGQKRRFGTLLRMGGRGHGGHHHGHWQRRADNAR